MGDKRKIVCLLIMFLSVIIIATLSGNKQPSEEKQLLDKMKEYETNLVEIYNQDDFTDDQWIESYRIIGLEFTNYNCEYVGNDLDVRNLVQLYSVYGNQMLIVADLLETGRYEEAIEELEEIQEMSNELEKALGEVYESYN